MKLITILFAALTFASVAGSALANFDNEVIWLAYDHAAVNGKAPAYQAPVGGTLARCNITPRDYPVSEPQKDDLHDVAEADGWALAQEANKDHCANGFDVVSSEPDWNSSWVPTTTQCKRWNGSTKTINVQRERYTASFRLQFRCKPSSSTGTSNGNAFSHIDPAVKACMDTYGHTQAYCELAYGSGGGFWTTTTNTYQTTNNAPYEGYGTYNSIDVCNATTVGVTCGAHAFNFGFSSGGWFSETDYSQYNNPWLNFTGNGMGTADPNFNQNPYVVDLWSIIQ